MKYIMFMTRFPDGAATLFKQKIGNCLYKDNTGEVLPNGAVIIYPPKLHTIRKTHRFKIGEEVSLRYWEDKAYRSPQHEFADTTIKGLQSIVISYNLGDIASDEPFVYVDGRQLEWDEINELAVNDGFDGAKDFFKWFKEDFNGWIIHWTDKKY